MSLDGYSRYSTLHTPHGFGGRWLDYTQDDYDEDFPREDDEEEEEETA